MNKNWFATLLKRLATTAEAVDIQRKRKCSFTCLKLRAVINFQIFNNILRFLAVTLVVVEEQTSADCATETERWKNTRNLKFLGKNKNNKTLIKAVFKRLNDLRKAFLFYYRQNDLNAISSVLNQGEKMQQCLSRYNSVARKSCTKIPSQVQGGARLSQERRRCHRSNNVDSLRQ